MGRPRYHGGAITAYDGDRVMAIFLGDTKNSTAVKVGLMINYAVKNLVNPAIVKQYPDTNYRVKQTVGIDTSKILAARTGIRGNNDIVWVGRSANYAAKLTSFGDDAPTWITEDVYNRLDKGSKYCKEVDMWSRRTWTNYNVSVYCSTYWWEV